MSWDFTYDSPKVINKLLDKEGLAMTKKFGQNFLISSHAREKLALLVNAKKGMNVWEIGPGLGALTSKLLETGANVKCFEIDYGFCRILKEQAFADDKNFTLVVGDALKTLFTQEDTPDVICGNLPYNVGSVCIAKLIENSLLAKRMVFTLQKEVAQRICGKAGEKNWSSISILCQTDYEPNLELNISPNCFYPEPNVESSVIVMNKLDKSRVDDEIRPVYNKLTRALFAQRRKTIKNNLLKAGYSSAVATLALEESKIALNERGEKLTIEQIITLSTAIKKQC